MKKILIIGCGSIGERHLRCFGKTGRATVGGCDPSESIRNRMVAEYGCPVFATIEEALEKDSWDAAVICTPAHMHLRHATLCLSKGVRLLIEKPLATDLDEASAFVQENANRPDWIRVAYITRSLLGPRLIKKLLGELDFGPIRLAAVLSGQNFPTFRPAYREIYYARHETGGGAIQDGLTHQINTVEWISGPVESLFCDASHQVLEGVEVEDTVNLVCRHAGGAMSSFCYNQFQAPNSSVLEYHCPGGSVRYESERQRVGFMPLGQTAWTWEDTPIGERDDSFVRQANSFLDELEGKPCNLCTLEEAFQTLRVNLAALESSRTGTKIKL